MLGARNLVGSILVANGVLCVTPVRADNDTESRAHFSRGVRLFEAGRYDEACEALAQAHTLAPTIPAPTYELGRCNEKLGKTATALRLYQEALRDATRQEKERTRKAADAAVRAIRPHLSTIQISIDDDYDVPDISIKFNGTAVARTNLSTPIIVDPGYHNIEATAPGWTPYRETVHVTGPGSFYTTIRETNLAFIKTIIAPSLKNVRIKCDGADLSEPEVRKGFWTTPGSHTVVATAAKHFADFHAIYLSPGGRERITISLSPIPSVPPSPQLRAKPIKFVVGYDISVPMIVTTHAADGGSVLFALGSGLALFAPNLDAGVQVSTPRSRFTATGRIGMTFFPQPPTWIFFLGSTLSNVWMLAPTCTDACWALGPFAQYTLPALVTSQSDGFAGALSFVGGGLELHRSTDTSIFVGRAGYLHALNVVGQRELINGLGAIWLTVGQRWVR